MAVRKLCTAKAIAAWITTELQKIEDCEECEVRSVTRLRRPDKEGCNWSPSVCVNTSGVPASHYGPYLLDIIREARRQFNVSA